MKTGAAGVLLTFAGTVLLIGISWLSTAFSGSVPWVLVGAALVLSIGGLALVFGSVSVSLMLALSRRVRGEADSSTDDGR